MTVEDSPLNVLLVDDQPNSLFVMRQILEKTGAAILEATSGQEALRQALRHECALILMDVIMPEMDGYETARLLQNTEKTKNIPILFVTGVESGEQAFLQGYRAGGIDFLQRPVSSELLIAKVSAFLELFRRRREEEKTLRLQQELSHRQEDTARLQALAAHLQEAREEERAHIAHEIHDELGSRLSMIRMELMHEQKKIEKTLSPEKMGRILSQVDGAIQTVRRVATSLRPPILDETGLFGALEWLAHDFVHHTPIRVELTGNSQNIALIDTLKIALFRVAQESVTNAIRHGEASLVEISLRRFRGRIQLSVADNGKGLPNQTANPVQGMGFRGMEERLRPFGGSLKLERSTFGGVMLTVTIPETPAILALTDSP